MAFFAFSLETSSADDFLFNTAASFLPVGAALTHNINDQFLSQVFNGSLATYPFPTGPSVLPYVKDHYDNLQANSKYQVIKWEGTASH